MPAADAVQVYEVRPQGLPDRARLKRAWPAVIAEVRKQKPARATTFVNTEVDVDVDGSTVVIEFPRDESFSLTLADEADTRQLLKRAFAAVLGTAPPFRFQLGRGAVQKEREPQAPRRNDVPPATVPDETTTAPGDTGAFPRVSALPPEPTDDVERLLVHGLGAEIIGEHIHESPDWRDEQ